MASLKQFNDEYLHAKGTITNHCILQNTILSKQSQKQQNQQQQQQLQPFQSVATLLQKIPYPQSIPGSSSLSSSQQMMTMLAMTPSTTPLATSPSMKVGRKISSNNAISLTIHSAGTCMRLQLALGAQSCRNNNNNNNGQHNMNFFSGCDINTVKMINTMKNKDNNPLMQDKWINNGENELTFNVGGGGIKEFKCNTARTTTSATTPREELKYFSSVKRQKQMLLEQQQQQHKAKQQSQQTSEIKGDILEQSTTGGQQQSINNTQSYHSITAVTSHQGESKNLKRERCAINKTQKVHKSSSRQQSIHGSSINSSNPQQGIKQSQENKQQQQQHSNISNTTSPIVVNDNKTIINENNINSLVPSVSKQTTKKHHRKSASQVIIATVNINKDHNNTSNLTIPSPKGQLNKLKQSQCQGNSSTNNLSISEQPQQQVISQQQVVSLQQSPGKYSTGTGQRQNSKFKSKSIHCLISSVINEEDQRGNSNHVNGQSQQQPRFYLKQPVSPCSISSPISSPANIPKLKSPQFSSNTSSAQIIQYQHRSVSSFTKQPSTTKSKKKSGHKQQEKQIIGGSQEEQQQQQQQQQSQQAASRTAEILSQINRNAVRIRRELSAKRKDDYEAEMKKKEERTMLKEKNNNIRYNNLIKFTAQQQKEQQQQQNKNNLSPQNQRIIPWGIDQQKLQKLLFKDCFQKESQKHMNITTKKEQDQEGQQQQIEQQQQSQKKTIDAKQRRIDLGLSCLNNLEESAIQTILQAQKKKEEIIKINGQKQEQISQQQQQQSQPQQQQRRSSPEEKQLIQQFMQTKKKLLDEQEQLIKKNDVSKQARLKLNLELLKHEIKEQQVSSTHSHHHKSSAKKQLKRQMKNYANIEYNSNNNNNPKSCTSPRQSLYQSPQNQLISTAFPYSQANSLSQEQENQVSEYIYEEFKRQFDWRGESQQIQQQGLTEQQSSQRGGQLEEQYYQLGEGEAQQVLRQQQQLSMSNRKRGHKHTKRSPQKENHINKSNNQQNIEGGYNKLIKDNGEQDGNNLGKNDQHNKPSFEERKLQVLMQFNSLSERLSKQIMQQNQGSTVLGELIQVGQQVQDKSQQQQNDHLFKNQLLQANIRQQQQQNPIDSRININNNDQQNEQESHRKDSNGNNNTNTNSDMKEIFMDKERIRTSELKNQNTNSSNQQEEKKEIELQQQKIYAMSEPVEGMQNNRRLTYGQDSEQNENDERMEETSQNRSNNVNAFDLYHQTYQTEEEQQDRFNLNDDYQEDQDNNKGNNRRQRQNESDSNNKNSTAVLLAEQTEKYLRSPKETNGTVIDESARKIAKEVDTNGNRQQQEQLIEQIPTVESDGSQSEGQYQEQQVDHRNDNQSMEDSCSSNNQYSDEQLSKQDLLILHMAAVYIQKVWRGYWTRKLIEMYFYQQFSQMNGYDNSNNMHDEDDQREENQINNQHRLSENGRYNDKGTGSEDYSNDGDDDIHAERVSGSGEADIGLQQSDRLQEEHSLKQKSEKDFQEQQEEIIHTDKDNEQNNKNKGNQQDQEGVIDSLINNSINLQSNENNNNVNTESNMLIYKEKYEKMRQEQLQKWGELIGKLKDAAVMDTAVNHELILQICQASEYNQLALMQTSFNAAKNQDSKGDENKESQLKEQKKEDKQERDQRDQLKEKQNGIDNKNNNMEIQSGQKGMENEIEENNNQLNNTNAQLLSLQNKDQELNIPKSSQQEQKENTNSQSKNDDIIAVGQLDRLQEDEMKIQNKAKQMHDEQMELQKQQQQQLQQQQYYSMRQDGLVPKRGECIPDIQRNRRNNKIPSGFIQTAPTPVNDNNNNTENQIATTIGSSSSQNKATQSQQGESVLPLIKHGFTEELQHQIQSVSHKQPQNNHNQDDQQSMKTDDSQQDQFQEYQRLLLSQSQKQQQISQQQQQQSSSSSSLSFSEFPADAYSSVMLKKESMESLMKMGKDVLKFQKKAKISIIHKMFEQHKVDPQTYDAKKKDIEQWELKEQTKLKKAHHEIERGWKKFAETVKQTKRGIEFMRQVKLIEQGGNGSLSKLSASGLLKEQQASRSFWSSRMESEGSEQQQGQQQLQQQYQDSISQQPVGRLSSNHSIRVINQFRLNDQLGNNNSQLKTHSSKTCQSDDEKVLMHTNESEESNFPEDINEYLRKMKELAGRQQQQNQINDQSDDILIKEFFGGIKDTKDIRNDSNNEGQQFKEESQIEHNKQEEFVNNSRKDHIMGDNNHGELGDTMKEQVLPSGDGVYELSASKPRLVGASNSLGQLGTPKVLVFDGSHLQLPYEVSPIPNIASPQQEDEKVKSKNWKQKEKELFDGDSDRDYISGQERLDEGKGNGQNVGLIGVESTPIRNTPAIMVQPQYSPFQKLESIQSSSESVGEGFLEGEPLLVQLKPNIGNIQSSGAIVEQIEKKPLTTADTAALCQDDESNVVTHDEKFYDKPSQKDINNSNNNNLNDMNATTKSSHSLEVQIEQHHETLPSEQQIRIPTSDEDESLNNNNINNNNSSKYLPIESCQNLNSIKDFLIALAEFIKENFREEFIERINQPLGIDPLEFLKTFNITDTTEQQQDTEASNSPMYPIVKYIHVQKPVVSEEIFLTFNELYQRMVRRQKKLELAGEDPTNQQDFDAFDDDENIDIFNSQSDIEKYNLKLIFDCLNESLDFFRVYSLGGSPLPWKLNQKKLSSAVVLDQDIERVLGLAIGRMLKWGSSLCGFISEKIEFPVGQEEENRVYLNQIKEDRLAQMLENEVLEGESKWLVYEEEETDVELEIADDIFHYLVSEAAQWMQYKMEGKLDQLEKEKYGRFDGEKTSYYQRNFEDMLKDEDEEEQEEDEEDAREILDIRKDLGNGRNNINSKNIIQKTNQQNINKNPANSTDGHNQDSIEERIIDDEDDTENDNITRIQEQPSQQQQQPPLQHLWTEKRRRAQMEERMSKQNERFIPIESIEQSPKPKQSIPQKSALQLFASIKQNVSSQNTNNLSF